MLKSGNSFMESITIVNDTAQKLRRNQLPILKENIASDSEFTLKNQRTMQILNTLPANKIHS